MQTNTLNRKKSKRKIKNIKAQSKMDIKYIDAKTDNQSRIMESFEDNELTVVHGYPGTGKTFIALYMALTELDISDYDKIYIVRSSVSTREIGFQPGKTDEKMQVHEGPYPAIVAELYGRGDAYSILKQKDLIEFMSTSFARGTTFNNAIVIIDEFQNMDFNELSTMITRFGKNCKMILTGDTGQDDLTSERYNEESGARKIMDILETMDDSTVGFVEMGIEDIVRSGFVKEFIIAKYA
ncbi:MAG: hypothetical protein COA52_00525 [Hyphomicrobiales bacterium]|nr:MAG: hypothetical protein COA52_00525 [Hyphomicrobiales bacterium]